MDKYITSKQKKSESPSRCFVSLDLKNMFNELSREKIFQVVKSKYPELLPLVSMLYREPGAVFFKMDDGLWHTESMKEGVNQGCPLSSTLAALILNEVLVPLTAKLKARAAERLRQGNKGDDGRGGETDPMAYIDDCGASVYVEDVWFFLEEFNRLGEPLGCHLNFDKTRIMTSTNGRSGVPSIRIAYGDAVADQINAALEKYSKTTTIINNRPVSSKVEITTGLRLLGQPLGSTTFAKDFFASKLEENMADSSRLLDAVPDPHTALRLFSQCALHKLPHLLGSEVMYCFQESSYERWNDWAGPLSVGIDTMVGDFLARLTQRPSIPLDSQLIAYMTIAMGGLGLMDASSRAIPDFIITMSQAIRYAEQGFSFDKVNPPYHLPVGLASLFTGHGNPGSPLLARFYRLLPDVSPIGAPKQCPDPYDYFLKHGSFKSMRDRLKQAGSTLRYCSLVTIARPSLLPLLSEILITSSSLPLINMCRSDPQNRRPPDLFLINLKMKLHLELFEPTLCPTCLCGQTIDPFGMHTFTCRRVSKRAMHDRIVSDHAPFLERVLLSAGIIGKSSTVYVEPKRTIADLPGLRPFDSMFRPVPNLKRTNIPAIPYSEIGFDYTVTSPKGHLSPSRLNAASIKRSATAAAHLIEKEKKKLAREGHCDPHNNNTMTGEQIMDYLLRTNRVLIPVAISPYGRWGPMFHKFLFGTMSEEPPNFYATRAKARQMYERATSYPTPIGIIPLATSTWKAEKSKSQHFYGHSYTAPTPKEWLLGKLGLAISNSIAIHLRDAKHGTLVPPTNPLDDDFAPVQPVHPPPGGCLPRGSTLSSISPTLREDFDDAHLIIAGGTSPLAHYPTNTTTHPVPGLCIT